MMMYMQAMMLNQEYWMLPAPTESQVADFEAPLLELCDVVMMTLGSPGGGVPATGAGCRALLPHVRPRVAGVGVSFRTERDRPYSFGLPRIFEAPMEAAGTDAGAAGAGAGVGAGAPSNDGVVQSGLLDSRGQPLPIADVLAQQGKLQVDMMRQAAAVQRAVRGAV